MPDEIRADITRLLSEAGCPEKIGICCINMDADTPDDNVRIMFEVVNEFCKAGG
jgi:predicted transcriptional regulator YheO